MAVPSMSIRVTGKGEAKKAVGYLLLFYMVTEDIPWLEGRVRCHLDFH